MTYYLLQIHGGDVEPELHGPFPTIARRDYRARKLRRADPNMRDGLFPLTARVLSGEIVLDVDAYSGGFFENL